MNLMLRTSVRRALLIAGTFAATATIAQAQQAEPSQSNEIGEVVIVTGSYIRGTAEDAALPVDVLTTDDLAKQGSPSMVDIIKAIPAVQNSLGESNQFGSQNTAGAASINLRGLSPTRTLVLLNGRRLATGPTGLSGVDTNLLPLAAIGRIEVLKDGAAATYGSDAIAGVVNFITKENLDGLDLNASYTRIEGSDGDYEAGIAYGWKGERSSLLVSGDYRHRSQLSVKDRNEWAVRTRTENPEGGWSNASNPGVYGTGTTGTTALFTDPACTTLGGLRAATGQGCGFQYIVFDNLVEDEDHYHAFAKYDLDISDSVAFHAEALYGMHDVKEEHVSPSYGPNKSGTNGFPVFYVPISHPGLQALLNNPNSGLDAAAINNSTVFGGLPGISASGLSWRPLAQGGNPATDGIGAQHNSRKFEAFRVSAGLSGSIGDSMNWDTAVTYSEDTAEISTPEILPAKLALALRGLGGPNCTGTTAGANGCQWFNPFSTAIASNRATGAPNTLTYNAATANDPNLIRWMTTPATYEPSTSLLSVDAVLSGELPWSLPGGAIGWAVGTQYREDGYDVEIQDPALDFDVSPCAQTPVTGSTACSPRSGALGFNGSLQETSLSRDMYALFTEMSFPIVDSLQAQLAIRYEDYGSAVGSTTNPKLSLRWQAFDWLALRGSAGTTFRAPTLSSLNGSDTTLQFTYTSYKPTTTYGNPDLEPETADTFNLGFIIKAGNFSATVDYWNFVFKDRLERENGPQMVRTFFGAQGTDVQDHCGDPGWENLQARFDFGGLACSSGNLVSTRANNYNAATDVEVSGIDASLAYVFDNVFTGNLAIGFDGTYNLEHKYGANIIEGIQIDPAEDLIGTRGGRAGTQPEWKGSAFIDWGNETHNVRWTSRYIDGVRDIRTTIAVGSVGKEIDEFLTHDLTYRLKLPWETSLTAAVFNVLDEEPPFARLDLSYDPFIGNPLGRYWKVGVTKRF